ncbi:MAG: serine/threonine protein kinase [Planctomycetaceae bacterium]|nr:serine/threonine protein kinase [Planctomycetaceae bacterium]
MPDRVSPSLTPNAPGKPDGDLRSPLVVELLKEKFEALWRDGHHPVIEDFLAGVAQADRKRLLKELLRIELDWRQQRLETHIPSEYFLRFSDDRDVVQDLFQSMGGLTHTVSNADQLTDTAIPAGAVPDAASSRDVPLRRVGNYEILNELARGGMGVVYRARQLGLGRIVALKMVIDRSPDEDENRRRFRREAESAGRLSHPGLVPIYEFGEHEGQLFYSMEHVEGESLEEIVRRGPLDPHHAARIMADVAEAVHYAHTNKVLHRDLKPSNVLLDLHGRPRVTDFGLARHLSNDSLGTAPGQVLGTPSYMPPEQAVGNLSALGPHSDVYSIGASLYHLLTGRPPFLTSNRFDTMQQVLQRPPVSPRTFDPQIPEELERIVCRCLEKSPLRRPVTALELSESLRAFLRQPVAVPTQSPNAPAHIRTLRRISLLGLCLAAALTVAAVATLLYSLAG